jgi:guanylate kinase
VLSAPSGGGKSTIVREIRKRHPELGYSVSMTTRPPRKGEKDGVDYRFVTEKEFLKKKAARQFVEYAYVHGYWYGTPKDAIQQCLKSGGSMLLDIDVQGGEKIKKIFPDAVLVFIIPPSLAVLETRLRSRRQDDEATIQRRLDAVRTELSRAELYDYLILNDDLHHAVEQLNCILMAERLRVHRNPIPDTVSST